jgi:hypothetical protein
MKLAHYLSLAGLSIALYSCTVNSNDYNVKGLEANPTMALPLAYGNLSISDLLKKQDSSYIKTKPDGLVYLSYDQLLKSQDIRNLISIPNISSFNTPLSVPPGSYPPASNDIVSTTITKVVNMGITPEALTEISFKSGTLSYNMSMSPNNPNFKYAALISIPEFVSKTGGAPLSQEVSGTGTIQLSNYIFKSATANKFNLTLTLIIKKTTNTVVIGAGTNINVNVGFAGMDFDYIKGFFGDQTVTTTPQTLDIQAFGTTLSNGATVSFAQPVVNLNVINDYGVPLEVSFLKLEARKQGSSLAMQTNPASPISINQPGTLGTSATTSVAVSNVQALINFAPTQFYYQASGRINKGLVTGSNFMADTSKMRVQLHVEIPLYGKASNIVLADTVDVSLSDVDQSKVESAALKALVTNELPLDASLQFYLTDQNYHVLDSLLSPTQTNIVKGSSVTSSGDLQTAGVYDQLIDLDPAKVQKIFNAKKIIVKAKMNTSKDASGAQVDVKFKSTYKIDIKLGLQVKIKLSATF